WPLVVGWGWWAVGYHVGQQAVYHRAHGSTGGGRVRLEVAVFVGGDHAVGQRRFDGSEYGRRWSNVLEMPGLGRGEFPVGRAGDAAYGGGARKAVAWLECAVGEAVHHAAGGCSLDVGIHPACGVHVGEARLVWLYEAPMHGGRQRLDE